MYPISFVAVMAICSCVFDDDYKKITEEWLKEIESASSENKFYQKASTSVGAFFMDLIPL